MLCTYEDLLMEAGKEKVKKICDLLRKETLEPARAEAEKILEEARTEARRLVEKGRLESAAMLKVAKEEIGREQEIFQTSLNQAARQSLEFLKQQIEEKLFNVRLKKLIEGQTKDPKVLSDITTAVVKAIEKEGVGANLSVFIPASVAPEKVNALLSSSILERLKEKGVLIASMGGGIQVKLIDENITIDLTAETLRELLAGYIRKDFRELFFAS